MRAKVLAKVGGALIRADFGRAIEGQRRLVPRPDCDFLRQFRDLKKRPTKRRLLNILERDKDENDLRPAENAIQLGILQLGIFGDDIPLDWIAKLGIPLLSSARSPRGYASIFHIRSTVQVVLGTLRLRHTHERLAQIYEELAGKPITYAKATDTSRGRKPGEPYGRGLEFMLAGLRLLDQHSTPHQAVAQIDRIRNAR